MTSEKLTLAKVIASAAYPFEAGSTPDRFARLLAELVPDYEAEADSPETTGSGDVNVSISSVDGRCVAINEGPHGDYPLDGKWQVLAWGRVDMILFLPDDADEATFAHMIRLLQAHGVLPEAVR
ncbi:hypothetical protein Acy02nite_68790 [Actinoplanes cyaneus]|uniref:Uncharacterized protein n=1 Tax=Actinoplanes cyaneus TaxID=52696 RepID=A0A919ISW3_9ACTN|nr:hypothetical protein [Actinoplanes cyaneus]MCW2139072.1 hypothetical protein [Actinoplanes cyaneus]GID68998.1 hypothetical protein Acy02nite_68790 [Actinoplanes cyaneus]